MGSPACPASRQLRQCHAVSGSVLWGSTESVGGSGSQSESQLYCLISKKSLVSNSCGRESTKSHRTSDTKLMCQTTCTQAWHKPNKCPFLFTYTVKSWTTRKSRWAKLKDRFRYCKVNICLKSYSKPFSISQFMICFCETGLSYFKAYLITSLFN